MYVECVMFLYIKTDRCKLIIKSKGVNRMSFKNPNKLKKKKNIVKKVNKEPKFSKKTIRKPK
jgi:hypothetical protein